MVECSVSTKEPVEDAPAQDLGDFRGRQRQDGADEEVPLAQPLAKRRLTHVATSRQVVACPRPMIRLFARRRREPERALPSGGFDPRGARNLNIHLHMLSFDGVYAGNRIGTDQAVSPNRVPPSPGAERSTCVLKIDIGTCREGCGAVKVIA